MVAISTLPGVRNSMLMPAKGVSELPATLSSVLLRLTSTYTLPRMTEGTFSIKLLFAEVAPAARPRLAMVDGLSLTVPTLPPGELPATVSLLLVPAGWVGSVTV